ncbi:hypothetical protein O3M35_008188 [Rhynocoris fuscipes]|uniref:Uncharacterized protein n=1 Tax=Rhynocoris fuscipes TaxID=488301 RepID=A0AAW1DCF9_9HEMI
MCWPHQIFSNICVVRNKNVIHKIFKCAHNFDVNKKTKRNMRHTKLKMTQNQNYS